MVSALFHVVLFHMLPGIGVFLTLFFVNALNRLSLQFIVVVGLSTRDQV